MNDICTTWPIISVMVTYDGNVGMVIAKKDEN